MASRAAIRPAREPPVTPTSPNVPGRPSEVSNESVVGGLRRDSLRPTLTARETSRRLLADFRQQSKTRISRKEAMGYAKYDAEVVGPIQAQMWVLYIAMLVLLGTAEVFGWAPSLRVQNLYPYVVMVIAVMEVTRVITAFKPKAKVALWLSLGPLVWLLLIAREVHIIVAALFLPTVLAINMQNGDHRLRAQLPLFALTYLVVYAVCVAVMQWFYTDTTGTSQSHGRALDPPISWAEEATLLLALAMEAVAFSMLENFTHYFAGTLVRNEKSLARLVRDNKALRSMLANYERGQEFDLNSPMSKALEVLRDLVANDSDLEPDAKIQLRAAMTLLSSGELFQPKNLDTLDPEYKSYMASMLANNRNRPSESQNENGFSLVGSPRQDTAAQMTLKTMGASGTSAVDDELAADFLMRLQASVSNATNLDIEAKINAAATATNTPRATAGPSPSDSGSDSSSKASDASTEGSLSSSLVRVLDSLAADQIAQESLSSSSNSSDSSSSGSSDSSSSLGDTVSFTHIESLSNAALGSSSKITASTQEPDSGSGSTSSTVVSIYDARHSRSTSRLAPSASMAEVDGTLGVAPVQKDKKKSKRGRAKGKGKGKGKARGKVRTKTSRSARKLAKIKAKAQAQAQVLARLQAVVRARIQRAIVATRKRERRKARAKAREASSTGPRVAQALEGVPAIGALDPREWGKVEVVIDHLYGHRLAVGPKKVIDFGELSNLVDEWNCDVFAIGQLTGGRPLYYTAVTLFRKFHLVRTFGLDPTKVLRFFERVEDGYIKENPYHNSMHATDVLQTVAYLISNTGLSPVVTDLEVLSALIAAMVHDMGHPGTNNNFQVASRSPLALRYNDMGVLEHFHCSTAFEIMFDPATDILSPLSSAQFADLRSLVIQMVLATDMSQHFDYLGKFKLKIESESLDLSVTEARNLVLEMAMKCADISNPTKDTAICETWAHLVMEEFFRQGEAESARGLPISPFMDRATTKTPKVQTGFIDFFVTPLYEALNMVPELGLDDQLAQLRDNRMYWENLAKENESVASSTLDPKSTVRGSIVRNSVESSRSRT
ncbi:uncharacterized protein AMSG_00147 [Thecamonas trahens ATCC 50062]|uniref:Phosphodiesterase n=1 Tax=Thecamonas trahens ATCC 50062 TaxID=461836 RepID=A0A0L0D0X4_THETB|nr:hypothetical protein AMSG_00147 [Thecamonas trahens ATCC 50062]KNC46029.1 hypothetical protein AMSG_00147 [Thecamonas trahens ATCC 50062]|eukprot:XP_013763009.1 hypothetical protein AMSG_00147 [Thecamonas trahens ATCC 50062]